MSRAAAARLPLGDPDPRPTFNRERYAMKNGLFPVAGCDEAGRGPLAGPVVAAAVILDPKRIPRGLNDSKKLTAETRAANTQRRPLRRILVGDDGERRNDKTSRILHHRGRGEVACVEQQRARGLVNQRYA